ncbi:MAG: OmpW family outer membrane protein [Burkholderiaceae bacterium]
MMNKKLLCLAAVALASSVTAAQAQSAGSFSVRLGATQIRPQVESGNLSEPSFVGTTIDIKKASQVSGGINYMVSDNISIDVPFGLPYKHDVVGDGAIAGVGRLATVKSLPITALAQYHFGEAASRIRPYVGAGATYARFYRAETTAALSGLTGGTPSSPTYMTMKNAWGPALELGVAVKLGGNWFASMDVKKVFLKTTGHLSSGQSIDTTLDPLAISAAIGYSF